MEEIQVDMASFFVLTPLPGSRDHLELHQADTELEPDYNRYDSVHETMPHPNFPEKGSLLASYQEAWETFYSYENMRRILTKVPKRNYWNLFQNFLWYKSAAIIEKRHPMMTGFFRLKGRTALRPGIQPLPRFSYYSKRFREIKHLVVESFCLLMEMQLLWLETRKKSEIEQRVLREFNDLRTGDSIRAGLKELQQAYIHARQGIPQVRVPSRFSLFLRKWNPFTVFSGFYSADEVMGFWKRLVQDLENGRLRRVSLRSLLGRIWLDLSLSLHFAAAWMRQSGPTRSPN
jgi:hypothetical protein